MSGYGSLTGSTRACEYVRASTLQRSVVRLQGTALSVHIISTIGLGRVELVYTMLGQGTSQSAAVNVLLYWLSWSLFVGGRWTS